MKRILVMLACLLFTTEVYAAPDFTDNWEAGYSGAKWEENGGCFSYSYEVVTNPCDAADHVMQVKNVIGDTNQACPTSGSWHSLAGNTCPSGQTCYVYKHRVELEPKPFTLRTAHLQDHWAGWSVMFTAVPTSNIQKMILSQIIPGPYDGTDFDLQLYNGRIRHQARNSLAGSGGQSFRITDLGPLQRDVWYNFVSHYKRSVNASGANSGRVEFWVNGVKRVDWTTGITSQSTEADGRWKLGFYSGAKIPVSLAGQTYIALIGTVKVKKVTDGSDQYAEVVPTQTPGECDPGGGDPPDPPITVPGTFPSAGVKDNFNRADENPVSGGGAWTNGVVSSSGACQVISNTLRSSGSATERDCYMNTNYAVPQEVYASFSNLSSHSDANSARLMACLQDGIGTGTVDGYEIRIRTNAGAQQLAIDQLQNGVYTQLGSLFTVSPLYTSGAKIGMRVESNNTLRAYSDTGTGWTERFTRTGTLGSCMNTKIGVGARTTTHWYDDFGGGTSTSGAAQRNLTGGHGALLQ